MLKKSKSVLKKAPKKQEISKKKLGAISGGRVDAFAAFTGKDLNTDAKE